MRVGSVSANSNNINYRKIVNSKTSGVNFQGKHDCAKLFGGLFAGVGTLGALGGIAIMTGGVSLIPTLIYGTLCGGAGVFIGHNIDKNSSDYYKKK